MKKSKGKFLIHELSITDRCKETDHILEGDGNGYISYRNGIKSEVLKISCEFISSGKTTKITNQHILNCIFEKLSTIS